MKMWKFFLVITRMERIRNKTISTCSDGHVQRRVGTEVQNHRSGGSVRSKRVSLRAVLKTF